MVYTFQRVIAALILAFAATAAIVPPKTAPVIRSPEVHPDRSVTFRIHSPTASKVTLTGDWMPPNRSSPLTKDDDGVWSVTLGPLAPGIAIYNFTVDGLSIADPVNPKMKLRARTSASLLEVPGGGAELWEPQDVPHGKVEINYLRSPVLANQTREVRVYTPPGYDGSAEKNIPSCICCTATTTPPPAGPMSATRISFSIT